MEKLSVEQEFAIAQFKQQTAEMSREELIQKLIETFTKMMEDDAKYQPQIKERWGVGI
jgi:hypothetical protein